jgi:hypothetical protein
MPRDSRMRARCLGAGIAAVFLAVGVTPVLAGPLSAARREQRVVLDVRVPDRAQERRDAFQRDVGVVPMTLATDGEESSLSPAHPRCYTEARCG